MRRILVEPASLRYLSSKIRYETIVLEDIQRRLNWAVSSLDWEVMSRPEIANLWSTGRRRSRLLIEDGYLMADYLSKRAGEFERADRECSAIQAFPEFHLDIKAYPSALLAEQIGGFTGLGETEARTHFSFCVLPETTFPRPAFESLGLIDSLFEDQASRERITLLCLETLDTQKART